MQHTEISRTHAVGFCLDEDQLRRLWSIITTRLTQKLGADCQGLNIEVTLEDGTVGRVVTIDEVLAIENSSPARVVKVHLSARGMDGEGAHEIDVTFASVPFQSKEPPIKFTVKSSDRDWAVITTGEVEERISKTRRVGRHISQETTRIVGLCLAIVPLVAVLILVITQSREHSLGMVELARDYRAKKLADPVDALTRLYLLRERMEPSGNAFLLVLLLPFAVLFDLPVRLYQRIFPAHQFSWGHELAAEARRKSRVNTLVIGFLLCGLLASLLGAYIQRLIGL